MSNIWDDFYNEKPPKKQRIVLENSAKKKIEYNARYNKEHTVTILVRLNKKTDADLIDLMDQLKDKGAPKSGYFKDAARCYMKCNPIIKK